jgi:CheY-like chemotaxis protein
MDDYSDESLLGQLLLASGQITPEELRAGLSQQQEHGGLLGGTLISMGALAPRQLERALASQARLRGRPWGAAPMVLVVEDDPEIGAGIADILRAASYRVAIVRSEAEALAASLTDDDARPSLIVLDLCLPEHGGIELLTVLRKNGATHDMPVIVLTGHPELEADIRRRGLDIAEFLAKPVTARRLIEAATTALREAGRVGESVR